jgi:hypothetical protein
MPQRATQGSLLRDLFGDGTDPVAVFLLASGQEYGAFAAPRFERCEKIGLAFCYNRLS